MATSKKKAPKEMAASPGHEPKRASGQTYADWIALCESALAAKSAAEVDALLKHDASWGLIVDIESRNPQDEERLGAALKALEARAKTATGDLEMSLLSLIDFIVST